MNKKKYANIALLSDIKTQSFLSSCRLYNNKTKEVRQLEFDLEWTLKQNYLYKTFLLDELNYNSIEKGLVPVFVTITLPSSYHPSSKNYKKYTVDAGYKKLVQFFRHLQNNFRHERKRVKFNFFRVCEPHKSFVPHFHAILWLPSESIDSFKQHHKNTIKLFKFNTKGQDLKVLDTANYAVVYLMKYVQKTLEGQAWIRGWSKQHNIRTVSSTRSALPSAIFKKISSLVKYDKDSKLPYINQILRFVDLNTRIFDTSRNLLRETVLSASEESNFLCSVEKERRVVFNSEPATFNIYTRKVDSYSYVPKYAYKILSFDIVDLETFTTYYSSTDYMLLKEGEFVDISFTVGDNGDYVGIERVYGFGDDDSNYIEYEVIDYVE